MYTSCAKTVLNIISEFQVVTHMVVIVNGGIFISDVNNITVRGDICLIAGSYGMLFF